MAAESQFASRVPTAELDTADPDTGAGRRAGSA